MTREEATKMLRREIECLSHTKCQDCILEEVCDLMQEPTNDKCIEAYELAVKALEQEPCDDCISRQALLDEIENGIKAGNYEEGYGEYAHINDMDDIIECIKYADSVKQEQELNIKALGEELRSVRNSIKGDQTLVGYNIALSICNKYLTEQEPKADYKAFAEWVAGEIFSAEWEFNKDSFAEIACRKLSEMGIVKADGENWALEKEPRAGWIPVSERLPEVGQDVLFSVGDMYTAEGCLREDGDWAQFRWNSVQRKEVVTAWKMLPEPYKESEK